MICQPCQESRHRMCTGGDCECPRRLHVPRVFLKLLHLKEPLPITEAQAKQLIDASYGGSLEREKLLELKNLKRIPVCFSHPMAPAYGEVYMENK